MASTPLGREKAAATKTGLSLEEWRAKREAGLHRCYLCKRWLPEDCFGRDGSRPSGMASTCKRCTSIKSTASRYGISLARAALAISGGRPDATYADGMLAQRSTTTTRPDRSGVTCVGPATAVSACSVMTPTGYEQLSPTWSDGEREVM